MMTSVSNIAAGLMSPESESKDAKCVEFLKIEDGISEAIRVDLRTESKRIYLGTHKRWIWGSVLALCCLLPAVAFIRSHSHRTQGISELDDPRKSEAPMSAELQRYSGFIAAPRHMPVPAGKTTQNSPTALNAYVPSGLSEDEWESIKSRDAKRDPGSWATVSAKRGTYEGKDLAKTGITKFNWVPMRKWIEDGQEHQFSAQLMDPSLRNKGMNVNWQQQPYMRAGSKKRPPVAEQFKRAIRDTMAGQNAAAGGTWLEGFLNDGLDEERENKPQPKNALGLR